VFTETAHGEAQAAEWPAVSDADEWGVRFLPCRMVSGYSPRQALRWGSSSTNERSDRVSDARPLCPAARRAKAARKQTIMRLQAGEKK